MWFPTNKPNTRVMVQEPAQLNKTTPQLHHLVRQRVTTGFPDPPRGLRSKGYGGHSVGETPGPIPNPEAKTHSADGTAPGRVWESRSPPDIHYSKAPTTPSGPSLFNTQPPHLSPEIPKPSRRSCPFSGNAPAGPAPFRATLPQVLPPFGQRSRRSCPFSGNAPADPAGTPRVSLPEPTAGCDRAFRRKRRDAGASSRKRRDVRERPAGGGGI